MRKEKSDLTRIRKKLSERRVNGECRIARRRDEFFRIRRFRRVYDRNAGKFAFNISYETHTKLTPRSLVVAEAFGLGIDEAQKFKVLDAELKIGSRDIVYITGDSLTGQSSMYWKKDGHLKYGNMKDLYEDFYANQAKSSFEILSSIDKKIKGSRISWQKVSDVKRQGIKAVYEITVSSAKSVEVTKDHSLFYSEGYQFYPIDLSRLNTDKRLVCSAKLDFFEGEEKNVEDYLLVLGGLWIADGSYYKTSIQISTGNNESILSFLQAIPRFVTKTERIARFIMSNPTLGNKEVSRKIGESLLDVRNARHLLPRYAIRSNRIHISIKKSGDASVFNKGLKEKLVELGFQGNCYTKRVPSWLFTASKRQIGLFLKGYFSGDGSFHTKGKDRVIVEAASVNGNLLKDIQTLLERIGIQGCINTGMHKQKTGFTTAHRKIKIAIERRTCIEKFLADIGFIYPIKKELIFILKKEKSVTLNQLMTRTVKEIKYIGDKEVFDICVPNSQCFIANGILCHNSGSGKSVLLRAIKADLGDEAIDLSEVAVDPDKPLIETVGDTVEEGLELLSKVGLNDAFLFLRTYSQLSDGQKYRYRIAKLIESGKQWWLMDEFAACLDRDTAKIIAFNLQKIARQQGKAVMAATTHGDLFEDLNPSVLVHKRFGEEIQINYYPNRLASECSLIREMKVEEGNKEDWHRLSGFHYRGHNVAVPRKIFRLLRNGELCGVIVYSYPPPSCYGRRLVLPRMTIREINKQLSIISRVVIHPKYRTVGLGAKLIHETLPLVGTPYIEMIAVMAKYNPFAEKAGMQKIAEQQKVESVSEVSTVLLELGFDSQLLGSERYVKGRLESLSSEQIDELKAAFIRNKHPRFKKEFAISRHQPFGKTSDYVACIKSADHVKMAKLVKLAGMLLQTKVYLFWQAQN